MGRLNVTQFKTFIRQVTTQMTIAGMGIDPEEAAEALAGDSDPEVEETIKQEAS